MTGRPKFFRAAICIWFLWPGHTQHLYCYYPCGQARRLGRRSLFSKPHGYRDINMPGGCLCCQGGVHLPSSLITSVTGHGGLTGPRLAGAGEAWVSAWMVRWSAILEVSRDGEGKEGWGQFMLKSNSVVIQSLSHVQLFAPPQSAALQTSLSCTISWSLLKLMSIESVMPSNHLILCYPLLLPPSIFPSIRVFSNELVICARQPKCWSFSLRISPPKEYWGFISFKIDWLDLLAVQGTLKSLLQHHSSKHQFFGAQLLYDPTLTSIHDYWKNWSFD